MKQYIIFSVKGAQCAPGLESCFVVERGKYNQIVKRLERAIQRSGFANASYDVSIYLLTSNAKRPNARAKSRKWLLTVEDAHRIHFDFWGIYQLTRLIFSRFSQVYNHLANTERGKMSFYPADNVYTLDGRKINHKNIYDNFYGLIIPVITVYTAQHVLSVLCKDINISFSGLFAMETVKQDIQKEYFFSKHNKSRWSFILSLLKNKKIIRGLYKQQPRYYKLEFGRCTQNPCYLTRTELARVIARANNNSAFHDMLE